MSTPTEKNIRLLVMLLENPTGYKIDTLMLRLEISKSTVYKYIKTINESGSGVEVDNEGGFFKIKNMRVSRVGRNIITQESLYQKAKLLLHTRISLENFKKK